MSDVIRGVCGHVLTSELRWSRGTDECGFPVVGYWAGDCFMGGRGFAQKVGPNSHRSGRTARSRIPTLLSNLNIHFH